MRIQFITLIISIAFIQFSFCQSNSTFTLTNNDLGGDQQ